MALRITLFMFLLLPSYLSAQRDTTRRDTSWATSPNRDYLRSIVHADVLEGRSIPVPITPAGQKICFDKKMKIKTITSRGPAEICVFINTKIGLIGYTALKPGTDPVCDIKPELSDFTFSIIGLKGNVFNYRNNKKKDVIEHWVQTSNSVNYQYEFNTTSSNAMLHKKTERRDYCGGKVKAQLYKVDGQPTEWFLFGKQFPDALMMQPKKFLGQFAVGYQQSDKGLFIIMQMIGTGIDSKILELEDVETCFDPAPFKVFEDEQQTKMTESIQRGREKIARDEAKTEKYSACQGKKTIYTNYQKEALNRQEENLRKSQQGNMMQNVNTQQAQADLMNYDDMIQSSIYETELKLCRAEQQQSERPSESTQKKLTCLNRQLSAQQNVKARFQALNNSLRGQPGKLFSEKAKIFMQSMVGCD